MRCLEGLSALMDSEADSTDVFFVNFAGQRRIAVRALTHPEGFVHTLLVQLRSSGRKTLA